MRIARFLWRNRVRWGTIQDDEVYAFVPRRHDIADVNSLSDLDWMGLRRSIHRGIGNVEFDLEPFCPLSEISLLAPIDSRYNKVVAIAANYGERDDRDGPGIFMKQPGTIVGPDDSIIYPRTGKSIIHEAELGVVIGSVAKNISVELAWNHVLGYTCVNDVSGARFTADDTGRGTSMRWKHFDTFCPVGPWIETTGAVIYNLDYDTPIGIQCRVNGETVVDGSTDDMLWNVAQLVSWVSEAMTLYPGDIIATGCPGVGEISVGDTVEVEVEGVGTLRNFVVADPAPPTADWPALIR